MASGPTLPPQAYTREILTAAFNWLQSQPESVRKIATSPDALVGLYLRAQRYGASSLENDAPISSQSFMSDLRNLAEGLKQFEDSPQLAPQVVATAPRALSHPESDPVSPKPNTPPETKGENPVPEGKPRSTPSDGVLTDRSLLMIQEVKDGLNLSSEAEVINLMVAIAYKKLKNLLD